MKVYSKVVFDMSTLEVLEEESFEYSGPVALCGGGGGSSGTVDYSTTLTNPWKDWIDGTTAPGISMGVAKAVNNAVGNSPFAGEQAYNPTFVNSFTVGSPLDKIQKRHDDYDTILATLDEEVDWDSMIDKVIAKIDAGGELTELNIAASVASMVTIARSDLSSIIADAVTAASTAMASANISTAVTAFENENTARRLRAVARVAAGMAGINAVNSSAFVMAMSLAEFEFTKEDTRFQENLKLEVYKGSVRDYVSGVIEKFRANLQAFIQNHLTYEQLRVTMLQGAVSTMAQLKQFIVQNEAQATQQQAEISRMTMVALKERDDMQLRIDEADGKWDLEMTIFGSSVLGTLAGATPVPKLPGISGFQSALGGAMSGAATGAVVGSAVPGIGTVAGAIGGGIGGLLASL